MDQEKSKFQGYRLECKGVDIAFGVSDWSFMNLKKPVLYVDIGNKRTKVASFNNYEAADWFLKKLDEFISEIRKEQNT